MNSHDWAFLAPYGLIFGLAQLTTVVAAYRRSFGWGAFAVLLNAALLYFSMNIMIFGFAFMAAAIGSLGVSVIFVLYLMGTKVTLKPQGEAK